MNTETGQIYQNWAAIDAAKERGEPIVMVSQKVAKLVGAGQRQERAAKRKRKRKQSEASRRANRPKKRR